MGSHCHSRLSTTSSYFPLQLPLSTLLAKSCTLAKLVYSFFPIIQPSAFIPFLTCLEIPLSFKICKSAHDLSNHKDFFFPGLAPLALLAQLLQHFPHVALYCCISCSFIRYFNVKINFCNQNNYYKRSKQYTNLQSNMWNLFPSAHSVPKGNYPQLFDVHLLVPFLNIYTYACLGRG